MTYDNVCKYLAEQHPASFVRWLLGIEAADVRVLVNQFQVSNTLHRYRVMRLWEQDPTPLLADPVLLPFATLAQGRHEGRHEGERELLLRLLTRKFGAIASPIQEQICLLSVDQLESLGEALLDFSDLADLVAWLEANQNSR
jgi:predicted transposase YdaD